MGYSASKEKLQSSEESQSCQIDRNYLYWKVPRRPRSKRHSAKGTTKVLNSGKAKPGIIQEHQSKNHSIGYRRPKKKRRRLATDSCDEDVIIQRPRVRGERRGRLKSSDQGKLDSKIFQDYMEHIWSTFAGENRNLFSCLDSLWFNLYSQKSTKEKVLNWIKKKEDMLSKKYILVPIVMWSHWSLLILCNFGGSLQCKSKDPCMLLLDSLQIANPKRLEPAIRKFVLDIYDIHQRPENMESIHKIPLLLPKVPQQRNGKECGNFVLYYISLFLENAPEDFSSSEGYPYFMKEDWFALEEFDSFCRKLVVESNTKNSLGSDE